MRFAPNRSGSHAPSGRLRAVMVGITLLAWIPPVLAETEVRTVAGFHSIEFAVPGELTLSRSDTETLTLDAAEAVQARILTEVENGVLRIEVAGTAPLRSKSPILIAVGYRDLDRIAVEGSGYLRSGAMASDTLDLKVAGSGRLEVAEFEGRTLTAAVAGSGSLHVKALTVESLAGSASGSGRLSLAGSAATQVVSLSGSGGLQALELRSADTTINLAGSGSARVWVDERLNVTLSGSGSVRYRGDPHVRQSVTGSGVVRKE